MQPRAPGAIGRASRPHPERAAGHAGRLAKGCCLVDDLLTGLLTLQTQTRLTAQPTARCSLAARACGPAMAGHAMRAIKEGVVANPFKPTRGISFPLKGRRACPPTPVSRRRAERAADA